MSSKSGISGSGTLVPVSLRALESQSPIGTVVEFARENMDWNSKSGPGISWFFCNDAVVLEYEIFNNDLLVVLGPQGSIDVLC